MNRRAFILSLFGGVAALELSALPDLATPRRMPPPGPLPDPQKWQTPYCYMLRSEMRGTDWAPLQLLAIRKDFWLTKIGWNAPFGAIAELHSGGQLLCRAMLNRVSLHELPLVVPFFMPAGESFVLKLKNAPDNFECHEAALLLQGFHLLSDAELLEARQAADAEVEDEDDSDEGPDE
jgi:hypothetical protein